ncbi:hypothetical protein PSSHI_03590 [Photobacterium sp. R1]
MVIVWSSISELVLKDVIGSRHRLCLIHQAGSGGDQLYLSIERINFAEHLHGAISPDANRPAFRKPSGELANHTLASVR